MYNCKNCNKQLFRDKKFCSRSCSSSYNNKLNPRVKKSKKCNLCQELIYSKQKYCITCWSNHRHDIQRGNKQKIKTNVCLNCSKNTKNSSRICCSNKCAIEYRFLQRVKEIESSGVIYSNTKFNTSAIFAKRYLRYKNGDICSICNQSNLWNNKPLVLILDHIDGIPNNWQISNLRLICPNCDSQTSTFKSKNKGKGRPR